MQKTLSYTFATNVILVKTHTMAKGPGQVLYASLLLALCVYCYVVSHDVLAAPLERNENIIFELLNNGEIDLSEDVAKAFRQEESITRIRRIGLFNQQHRIRAAFRDKFIRSVKARQVTLNDAYYHELAAYVISRYLGLNIIPPTVSRSVPIAKHGLKPSQKMLRGTLQFWVENSIVLFDLNKQGIPYPGLIENKDSQIREITAFDCIIGNVDRHAGNLLVDLNARFKHPEKEHDQQAAYLGKIWAIDHSRAFYKGPIRVIDFCHLNKLKAKVLSRQFIAGIRAWRIKDVELRLKASGLTEKQLDSLALNSVERRFQKVKAHFEREQMKSGLSDEEFYTSGAWHQVW